MRSLVSCLILFTSIGSVAAQVHDPTENPDCPMKSPYSGLETREIKALSDDDRRQLLAGHGMGLALAAELNRFPGPKHVLELSDQLKLEEGQIRAAKEIFEAMEQSAIDLGRTVLREEALLDARFAAGSIDHDGLARSVLEIGRLRGELRLVHLQAHLHMRAVMSDEQVASYDRLRGYRRE